MQRQIDTLGNDTTNDGSGIFHIAPKSEQAYAVQIITGQRHGLIYLQLKTTGMQL